MRKLPNFAFFMALAFLVTVVSCKKDDEPEPDDEIVYTTPNDRVASAEVDEVVDQVNDLISNKIGGGSNMKMAAGAAYNLPCGVVSVDSSTTTTGGKKIYKLNYGDKTQCGYKYKSGEVSFALENTSTGFSQAGAVFKITFTNYEVQVNATGSYVKLNGTISVTNQSGGYVWQVLDGSTIITHKIRGTLNITYYDNEVRTRSYYQSREWSSPGGNWENLTLVIDADSTDASSNKISEVGTTYTGEYEFKTLVNTPFKWTNCGSTWAGPYRLIEGAARLDFTVPLVSPTYIDVTAGYYWDYTTSGSTPTLSNSCSSNAYQIHTVLGSSFTSDTYQLY